MDRVAADLGHRPGIVVITSEAGTGKSRRWRCSATRCVPTTSTPVCGTDVEPAIRRLLDCGLVVLGPDGEPQFRHLLAREAVADSALSRITEIYGWQT